MWFPPAAARKEPSFSFDFAASPQNQMKKTESTALPEAKKAVATAYVVYVTIGIAGS
jgi:hypothetical protein